MSSSATGYDSATARSTLPPDLSLRVARSLSSKSIQLLPRLEGDVMKLGIGLPNTMTYETDRRLMLDWARLADDAGFHELGTIDKPNYDSWDPLATLAGVAGVTERIRLATTILQLPPRNEVLVAKQAATIDQLSGGRLDLGLGQGGREDDFQVFDAEFSGRGERFERQVARVREIWQNARESDRDHGVLGPPPVQTPGPPIWVGALQPKAIERAVRNGDGFIFGTAGSEVMAQYAPGIREAFSANGKPAATIAGLAYVALGEDAQKALDEATHHVLRYYGQLWTEPANLIHHGPPAKIAEEVAAYAGAIDVLILFPEIPQLDQVEQLAEHVLPAYV
jgi:alkanesulfonate monooxygenase SsuD/methylene tetrahydromethanopterin reductase-like flavin-dependent oxidoreductase (luciferase family)